MRNQTGEKIMTNIEQKINEILARGTRIVAFDYSNKRRNILVGSNSAIEGSPIWGEQISRGIREYRGKRYLVGIDNNDSRQFKVFELAKIENPSFA